MMNSALIFQTKATLRNTLKQLLKKPLKLIGTILVMAYFVYLPFMTKGLIDDWNLNTPAWFIVFSAFLTIYITMPSTLTYFKRKGVVFRKQDINLVFATPISPKQALLYAVLKMSYLNVFIQCVFGIAAIFIFNIPVHLALVYGVGDLIFSSLLQYSLALIMYASETITLNQKAWIRRFVYAILVLVTGYIGFYILQNGISTVSITKLVSYPPILLIPVFGWQLGWLNLVILGPTLVSIISTSLFIISALGLTWYAITMPCTGEYYEDALAFSEKQAILEAKKGDVSFSEALGQERKIYANKIKLFGTGAQVLLSRQIIERKRSSRFFIKFSDLIYFVVGIGLGLSSLFMDFEFPRELFFAVICGITLYFVAFFSPAPTWKDEFKQPSLYIIPDSIGRKLFYATLLDHGISLLRALFLTIPAGIGLRASWIDIFLAIIAQVLIRATVVYVSVFTREYLGAKLGTTFAQFMNIIVVMLVLIVPAIALFTSTTTSTLIGFIMIAFYSLLTSFILIKLSEKILANIESLRD